MGSKKVAKKKSKKKSVKKKSKKPVETPPVAEETPVLPKPEEPIEPGS